MSKIQLDRVEFRNFFSYGNNWNEVELKAGLNLVLGKDEDKDRSNGAGKCVKSDTVVDVVFCNDTVEKAFLEFIDSTEMKVTVKQVCDFYSQYPNYIGTVSVKTPYGFNVVEYADVTARDSDVIVLETEDKILECSPDHRVLVAAEWVPVKDVVVGDVLGTITGDQPVVSVRYSGDVDDLYDFQVEGVHQYYTNGILSHNSSFLETIPFALFGKTSKGVSQSKILNWTNGKNCEVRLHLKRDGGPYIIHRGIKPGTFDLYKDGDKVPMLSSKQLFQKEIEDDIIGMDHKMSEILLFQNANNMISLFNSGAADKRAFMDRLFDLDRYSKAKAELNRKISDNNASLQKAELEFAMHSSKIVDLETEVRSIVLPDIALIREGIDKLNLLISDCKEVDGYDELKSAIDGVTGRIEDAKKERYNVTNMLSDKKSDKRSVDKEVQLINDRLESIGDLAKKEEALVTLHTLKGKLDVIVAEKPKIASILNEKRNELTSYRESVRLVEREIESNQDVLDGLNGKLESELGDVCQECFQEVDHEHAKSYLSDSIENRENKISELVQLRDGGVSKLDHLATVIAGLELEFKDVEGREKALNEVNTKIAAYTGLDKLVQERDSLSDKIVTLKEGLEKLAKVISDLEGDLVDYNNDIDQLQSELGVDMAKLSEIERVNARVNEYRTQLRILEGKLETEKAVYDRLVSEKESKSLAIESKRHQMIELDGGLKRFRKLVDTYGFINETLKDTSVKQYAISNIVPFIQQRCNKYLADAGHNYYVELDNWLNGTICGQGVGDNDFGNMSGGEGKSIDLSLKFAMMDVALGKRGTFPDVLILDELLDSSIDSYGLSSMVDIIRSKQSDGGLKTFIVSHREEVGEIDVDNTYLVTKNNGFSNVRVI